MSSRTALASRERIGLWYHVRGPLVPKGTFLEGYGEDCRSLAKRLRKVVEEPAEDEVHGLRTAIRRLDARVGILPKRLRGSPGMRELLKSGRRVMKRTAEVRDLDVMRGKLSRQKSAAGDLLRAELDEKRGRLEKRARRAAERAREVVPPEVRSKEVTQRELQKRLEKVVGRLSRRIDALFPVVAMDPARLEELHELRISSKKLALHAGAHDGRGVPGARVAQEAAGPVGRHPRLGRGVAYVEGSGIPDTEVLLNELVRERQREFERFATSIWPV